MNELELRSLCFHEAGHAVTAVHVGVRFENVSTLPDIDSMGRLGGDVATRFTCSTHLEAGGQARSEAEAKLMCSYAGAAAQTRYLRSLGRDPAEITAEVNGDAAQDAETSHVLARRLTGTEAETEALERWLRQRVNDLIEWAPFWKRIEAVAHALEVHRTLRADEVRTIAAQAQLEAEHTLPRDCLTLPNIRDICAVCGADCNVRPLTKPPDGPTPGRNDPCWCGSGRKYKVCHGA